MTKLLKIANTIQLTLFIPFASILVVVAGFYFYESTFDWSSKIKYYTVVSTKDHYEEGEEIHFLSFNVNYATNNMEWNEIIYCSEDGGLYNYYDETAYVDKNYDAEPRSFSQGLLNLFEYENLNQEPTIRTPEFGNTVGLLRAYAEENNMSSWRLTVDAPPVGASCYVKHDIIYYTERLNLERKEVIYSNKWTYGTLSQPDEVQ